MPRFLGRLTATLALAALAFLPRPTPGADTYELLLTGNSGWLFPVMAEDPPVEDAAAVFERELREEKEDREDALLVEGGNFASLATSLETSYTTPSGVFHERLGFDVVNLSPRDAAFRTAIQVGLHYGTPAQREQVITGLKSDYVERITGSWEFPDAKTIDYEDQPDLTFISVTTLDPIRGITGLVAHMSEVPMQERLETIGEARARGDLVVAFSSLGERELTNLLREEATRPHLLIDLLLEPGADPFQDRGAWRMPLPRGGTFQRITLRFDDGELREPRVRNEEVLEPGEYDALLELPLPAIGVPIPNLDAVMQTFFGISADSVEVDRLPTPGMGEVTTAEDATVYRAVINGESLRIYRLRATFADRRLGGARNAGWPPYDFLVILDENHLLNRVITRVKFPVNTLETSMEEALNRLRGLPPERWQPDPVLAAGLEGLWEWTTMGMHNTIAIDRVLYGEGRQ